jgi:RNA polymerase sigma-70 factor, ECF subfamily
VTTPNHNHDTSAKDSTQQPPEAPNAMDHAQLTELIKKQYSGLYSLLRRKLKDRELAADLINEAVAITLEHAQQGRLKQLTSVGGYIFRVSINLLRNHQRNADNRSDLRADVDALNTLAEHDNDVVEATQLRRRAQRLIESLSSPRDREVVKRFYLDEQDKESICKDLKLTPLQFTQIISRARHRMKQAFDAQGFERADYLSLTLLAITLINDNTTTNLNSVVQHIDHSRHLLT